MIKDARIKPKAPKLNKLSIKRCDLQIGHALHEKVTQRILLIVRRSKQAPGDYRCGRHEKNATAAQ
jgi:hypothetical protein